MPLTFAGALAISLLSGILVPPGSAIPPPLWPVAVALAAIIGLCEGPAYGLAAGACAGAIPVVSAALSVSSLTTELSSIQTAFVLASVAPPLLAGTLRR
jgi:hydrogenase/urease accessory protein HupE